MTAILKSAPRDLSQFAPDAPASVLRVVEHCLEKDAAQRFQSAQDLVFNLESSSQALSTPALGDAAVLQEPEARRWLPWAALATTVLALAAAAWFGAFGAGDPQQAPDPIFRRLTFERGIVQTARFTADGSTIVYSSAWENEPLQLYLLRADGRESQRLQLPGADLLSISPGGELAVSLGAGPFDWFTGGMLAQVPLLGESPREVLEGVVLADWVSENELAAWRITPAGGQLEFPLGNAVHTGPGVPLALRVSPDGERVAVHITTGLIGTVDVFDREGNRETLAADVVSAPGLAWTPDGTEVWFGATPTGELSTTPAIYAVTMSGERRLVSRIPGWPWLHDISSDGQALITHNRWRGGIAFTTGDDDAERELAWLDWSVLADLSSDGEQILFTEAREGVDNVATVYSRGTDGSPAVRLGEGVALALSDDASMALALRTGATGGQLVLLPTRAGSEQTIDVGMNVAWGMFLPDGRVVFTAMLPTGMPQTYVHQVDDGTTMPITPEGVFGGLTDAEGGSTGVRAVSPDGRWLLASDLQGAARLYAVDGDETREALGVQPGERVAGWSATGTEVFVFDPRQTLPNAIVRVDLTTGERAPFQQIGRAARAGVHRGGPFILSADGEALAYGYAQTLSDLYLVQGLR